MASKICRPKKNRSIQNDARIKACIKCYTTRDHIPYTSFFAPLATVWAHTRQRSTSYSKMPVTLRTTATTTTSSSSCNRCNKMTVQDRQRHAVCRHPLKCFSSLHALALPLYCVDILGSVPVVSRLWQQWTAAVPYAVLQSRWFCASCTL